MKPGKEETVAGEGADWHYHAEMELTWFAKGRGTRLIGDGISSIVEGELVLIGGNLPHCWHVAGESAGISIQWNFPKGHPFWTLPETVGFNSVLRDAERGILIPGSKANVAAEMMGGLMKQSGMERLGGLFSLLGFLSAGGWSGDDLISTRAFPPGGSLSYRKPMERVMTHVISNFRDEISLDDLLEIAAMSRPTFSRHFKLHTGRSFSDFLLRLRLETAARELMESDEPVTAVAYGCGFGNVSFFNRSFRRAMKCSPTEFRRRQT